MKVCTRLFQPMSPFPYPSLHLHTVYFRYHFPVVKFTECAPKGFEHFEFEFEFEFEFGCEQWMA